MSVFLTTGEAAHRLGISRDKLMFALRSSGAPEPRTGRLGGRRIFSEEDVERLRKWFSAHGKAVNV